MIVVPYHLTKARAGKAVFCPNCHKGKLCRIVNNNAALHTRARHMDARPNVDIVLKCPICNSQIGLLIE